MIICTRCGRPADILCKLNVNRYGEVTLCLKCQSSYTDIRECINDIIDIFMSGKEVGIDYWEREES